MHRAGLRQLTLDSLEIIEATFPGDLTLELFHSVKGHACSICSVGERAGSI